MAETPRSDRRYPEDVHVLEVDGREFIVVGTAHISRESVGLVREVIEKERPDCVCVELDPQRYQALSDRSRFEALDLREVIRRQQLSALMANLLLAAYQKRLGGALGVLPGTELLEATRAADEFGIPVVLADRDIRATLRRAWSSVSLPKKLMLLATLITSLFERTEVSEEDLRRLREQDALSELMREFGEALPGLKTALIDERDAFLAEKVRTAAGDRIVAVVGAGHVQGMLHALRHRRPADLASLEEVPPVSPVWRWMAWGIPVAILASLVAIGVRQGAEVAGQNLLYWILANGIPSTLGALLAAAHPLTIAGAFFVAPVTSLTPVIGAGYVLAFLQAWLRPPLVRELERVTDDALELRAWWRNRLLRILLVFVFTTLGSLVGTYVGGYEILSTLFGGAGG